MWTAIGIGAASLIGGAMGANASKKAAAAQQQATQQQTAEQRRQYEQTRTDQSQFMGTGIAGNQRLSQLLGLSRGAGTTANGPIPQDQFDGNAYLAANPDVAKAGVDPYQHYLQFGQHEQRQGYKLGDFQGESPLLRKFTADDLAADPVYQSGLQFGADQGRDAINARAIAGGGYDSGATLKALTRFGNDYGSTKAGESYNRFTNDQSNVYNKLAGVSGAGQVATGQVQSAGTNMANATTQALGDAGNARAAGIVGGANAWGGALGGASGAAQGYQSDQTLQALLKRKNNPYAGGYTPSEFAYTGYGAGGDYQYG